ncbi:MAG: archaeosortase A [Thermoplasmata archaeon]|nr:archaeosortase A [Thermoplasmata archaeon]
MLGIGYVYRKRISHLILIGGWIIFGIYWLTQIPHFIEIEDTVNATLAALGMPLFLYFAYHEYLSYKWDENLIPLRFIAGAVFVAGMFYYIIEKVEVISKGLIYIVALKSVWILNLFGYPGSVGEFDNIPPFNELGLHITHSDVSIILACTGIQAIALFVGAIIVTKTDRSLWQDWAKDVIDDKDLTNPGKSELTGFKLTLRNWKKNRLKKLLNMSDSERKWRAFMYTGPVIYFINLFRNAGIIYATNEQLLGDDTFNIAHHYIGKALSLFVLIILVFVVFEVLPEFLENILGIMDLNRRNKKGMVVDGFVELEDKSKKATYYEHESRQLKKVKAKPKV